MDIVTEMKAFKALNINFGSYFFPTSKKVTFKYEHLRLVLFCYPWSFCGLYFLKICRFLSFLKMTNIVYINHIYLQFKNRCQGETFLAKVHGF